MAIQATSEEQLRMRRRARRRLLGAATLLLIAAIVLPMVLDQAPRPLDRDIEISIPSQTTAPLPAVAQMRQAPAQPAPAAPVPAAPQPAELMPQSEPASAVTAPPAKTAEADKAKPEAAKPPVPPKAPQAEAHPSAEKPKSKPAAESKPVAAGHFVVQLGVFSRAENVQQLRAKLSAGGITTYTEALPNGTTRVHAGAFKLRPQAEQMQAKIAFLGVQARIVNLEP